MVYWLRYFYILVYLMHDMNIQLVAIQELSRALRSSKLNKFWMFSEL